MHSSRPYRLGCSPRPFHVWILSVSILLLSKPHFCNSTKPNIVVVLTDDLDLTLGGWKASTLAKTRAAIANQGVVFENWFAQTPVCCPSRAELLTGKYFHNLWAPNPNERGCMHVDVESKNTSKFYQRDYFAKYFKQLDYTVGLFGKHLNMANPTDFIPDGVDAMLINGGGQYLNPEFQWATRESTPPQSVKFDNCTDIDCYYTSVVGNASLAWIRRHVVSSSSSSDDTKPFFGLISVKAPHVQDGPGFPLSIPAPWYQNISLPEQRAPRTLNYNQSCPDHHWLVRTQPPLTTEQADHIDQLYQSRLKTLLSVDDLVQELMTTLEDLNVLQNTYIVFTSDNGYRLGQFRMPCCKLNPYEDDIRIPMMIRGPGIVPFSTRKDIIGTHVDLMPTLLGLAVAGGANANNPNYDETHTSSSTTVTLDGRHTEQERTRFYGKTPSTMDGINLASQLLQITPSYPATRLLVIEYKSLGDVVRYEHMVDTFNHTFIALRVLDTSAPVGFQNLKYVQYRDSRLDWNSTHHALEQELFDLDLDPYEMTNLAVVGVDDNRGATNFLEGLSLILARMRKCQGYQCRQEELSLVSYYSELVHQTLTMASA